MTFLTGDVFLNMPLVIEQYMFGQDIGLVPAYRCPGIEIRVFFLNPVVIADDMIMTMQAFFNRWQARMPRITHIRMAILTLNVFYTGVDPMAERYRLFRADTGTWRCVEKIDKACNQHSTQNRYENGVFVSTQRCRQPVHQDTSSGFRVINSGNWLKKVAMENAISPKKPMEIRMSIT